MNTISCFICLIVALLPHSQRELGSTLHAFPISPWIFSLYFLCIDISKQHQHCHLYSRSGASLKAQALNVSQVKPWHFIYSSGEINDYLMFYFDFQTWACLLATLAWSERRNFLTILPRLFQTNTSVPIHTLHTYKHTRVYTFLGCATVELILTLKDSNYENRLRRSGIR